MQICGLSACLLRMIWHRVSLDRHWDSLCEKRSSLDSWENEFTSHWFYRVFFLFIKRNESNYKRGQLDSLGHLDLIFLQVSLVFHPPGREINDNYKWGMFKLHLILNKMHQVFWIKCINLIKWDRLIV